MASVSHRRFPGPAAVERTVVQAIVAHEWGGPDVLRVEEVADPKRVASEVVVELRASAVNWHDVLVRRTGRGYPLPSVLGMDGAGVRRDTREEVVILPALRWGERRDAPGPAFEFLGDATDGTYAELIRVPAENLFTKPSGFSWEEAAALPTAGLTAYRALFTRGGTRRGETVLVLGAGSGVSTIATCLAAAAGARVLVTSSSAEKLDRARQLGAVGGALYTSQDWVEEIKQSTGGAVGVDVVIDGVGAGLADSLACLRPGGRVALFGASGGAVTTLDVPDLFFRHASILATSLGDARDFAELLRSVDRASWRPVIDSVRPLGEVGAAHQRMESRSHFGKLVLTNT
jgi:zinc-binding alcohol dehydrogenase/oxidoreductase